MKICTITNPTTAGFIYLPTYTFIDAKIAKKSLCNASNNKLLSVVLLCDPDLITVTNFIIIFITLLINV